MKLNKKNILLRIEQRNKYKGLKRSRETEGESVDLEKHRYDEEKQNDQSGNKKGKGESLSSLLERNQAHPLIQQLPSFNHLFSSNPPSQQ